VAQVVLEKMGSHALFKAIQWIKHLNIKIMCFLLMMKKRYLYFAYFLYLYLNEPQEEQQ
jgi:hypothetical protein